eukprot:5094114-Pyramimonas_sp.AAC.1
MGASIAPSIDVRCLAASSHPSTPLPYEGGSRAGSAREDSDSTPPPPSSSEGLDREGCARIQGRTSKHSPSSLYPSASIQLEL